MSQHFRVENNRLSLSKIEPQFLGLPSSKPRHYVAEVFSSLMS